MSLPALILVLGAAGFHAGWNLLLKQSQDKYVILWWAGMATALLALPVALLGGAPAAPVWPFVLLSALTEVAYMATLAYAYDQSDFSLVYPIARGAAPGFLAIWSVLFLGDRPTWQGASGLVILITGLVVVGSSDWWGQRAAGTLPTPRASLRGIALALAVALLISTYSAIDGAAVQRTAPTPYTVIVIGLTGPLFTPVLLRRYAWKTIAATWVTQWRRILVIAGMSLLAYVLVLNAYAIAPVSYAGAIREVSIVFAALAGWRLLGENRTSLLVGKVRMIGAGLIFCGILVIASA